MINSDNANPLQPEDIRALAAIRSGNDWLRAALCTLARRGIALRQAEPERAQYILQELSVYPLFKAGQFLFDLMEWEDFMLDGEPPELVATTLDGKSATQLVKLLNTIKNHLDGGESVENVISDPGIIFSHEGEELPALEGGFFLYHDVVIGIISSLQPLFKAEEGLDQSTV